MTMPRLKEKATDAESAVRYWVLLLCFLAAGITYLDRVCIAAAAPQIKGDLGLSNVEMGYVFGVFALAYGLFEIPTGWLGDRWGQRRMLTRIVLCWSAFTMLTGFARSYTSLLATRFVFGAAEAGAFPTLSRALTRWFPVKDRGMVNGILWMGARFGGAIAPPLATFVIAAVGWRFAFGIFGLIGFCWCVVFWLWYRDNPADHPGVSLGEVAYIRQHTIEREHERSRETPWKRIFLNGNLWALVWMYFATSYGFWFFLTWMPTYLIQERGLSAQRSGFYAGLPLAVGAIACVSGGALSDWLVRRTGSLRWGRRAVGMGGFLLTAVGFWAAYLAEGALTRCFALHWRRPRWTWPYRLPGRRAWKWAAAMAEPPRDLELGFQRFRVPVSARCRVAV